MAYTQTEKKRIDDKAIEYFNRLNLKYRENGQLLTENEIGYNKSNGRIAAEVFVESVESDNGNYLKCDELLNPDTGNTGIIIEELLDVGGQSCIFRFKIPNFDALKPLPFYQRIYQHTLRDIDGGNLDSVRDIYSQRASEILESRLKRAGGREYIKSELKPRLIDKFRGGRGVLRINRGGEDVFSAKKSERVRAFDGYMHENLIFSALSSKNLDGRDFSLLEYVPDIINPQKISEELSQEEQISIAIKIANGLNAFYQLGTIHRDIKPDNILISKELDAKIADFGLVKLVERNNPNSGTVTDPNVRVGSPKFGSPEHFMDGMNTTDIRSDICSLGLTIYYWVTGEHAIAGEETVNALENAKYRAIKPRRIINVSNKIRYRGIPPYKIFERKKLGDRYAELEKVIAKMIHLEQDQRYETPAEVATDLERVLAGERVDIGGIDIYDIFS